MVTSNLHSSIYEQIRRRIVDIELVLWELQRFVEFFSQVNEKNSIVARAVATNIFSTVHSGWGMGHLKPASDQLIKHLQRTIGLINEQVYDLYSYDPEPKELKHNWLPLVYQLLEFGARLDVFTTNYDLVIENALHELNGDEFMYSYVGASGRVQRFLDLKQWNEDADRSGGLLTKLHGSLNWKSSASRIALGDSLFTGSHAKHAIIYPGFKGRSNAIFFEPFHDYFSRMLAAADHVLVIGFAFRDEYISQILRSSLAPNATVTVVDPEPAVQFPLARDVIRLERGFDRPSVDEFLTTVRQAEYS